MRRFRDFTSGSPVGFSDSITQPNMWEAIFGWTTVGILVPLIIGFGWVVISISSPQYDLARGAFSVSATILVLRICWWLALEGGVSANEGTALGVAIWSFLLFGTIGCLWALSLRWVNELQHAGGTVKQSVASKSPATPVTLEDLFKSDLPQNTKVTWASQVGLTTDQRRFAIRSQIYYDFLAHTSFVGFYVPEALDAHHVISLLPATVLSVLKHGADNVGISTSMSGPQQESNNEMSFSGRVFVYHLGYLSPKEIGELTDQFSAKKMAVQFRGLDYAQARNTQRVANQKH